jgi:hypothetical protein
MNKFLAAGGTLALLAGGLVYLLTDAETGATVAYSVPVNAKRIDKPCDKERMVDCKDAISGPGWCLCLSEKTEKIIDEVDATAQAAKPTKDRKRLVACGSGKSIKVRWEALDKPLAVDCSLAADEVLMPEISMGAIETDVEAKLRDKCKPCHISAGSWGPCPYCLRADGGCAKACPAPTGGL